MGSNKIIINNNKNIDNDNKTNNKYIYCFKQYMNKPNKILSLFEIFSKSYNFVYFQVLIFFRKSRVLPNILHYIVPSCFMCINTGSLITNKQYK